jgi:sugar-specific transcriptional regulator TrmB
MLDKELQKLGLSDKEAKVYLSSLELGPSPVQVIAQKAGVNRATTYVMIESLISRGLMSSFEKGKKRYFTAESPDQLMTLLKKEEAEIETKIKQLEDVIPELKMVFASADEKPKVRFFEGVDGGRVIQEDILNSKFDSMEEILFIDDFYKIFPPHEKDHRHNSARKFKDIPLKTIYTSKIYKKLLSGEEWVNHNVRRLPFEKFPYPVDITIYGKKVAIVVCQNKAIGVIIESEEIAKALRAIFNLAWEATEKYQN